MALTAKQQKFADEYLIDLNATQAAIRAGYSTKSAEQQGSTLLRNPKVSAHIDERMAVLSRRTGVNQERIMRELSRIAFLNAIDVVDVDDATIKPGASREDTAVIASVKVKTIPGEFGDGEEREIKFADKLKALELLGKRFGMFTENVNLSGALGVQIIDDIGSGDDA